jgi:hypothetical protein
MPDKQIRIRFGSDFININVDEVNGGGGLVSSLADPEDDYDEYKAAIDSLETLLLKLAVAGVDIESQVFVDCIEETASLMADRWA